MATIQLTTLEWAWYIDGRAASSAVIGYESSKRRVGRFQFTAPSTGATGVTITLHIGGRGAGSHIPIRFYIGTSPTSHANAGYDAEYTGTLTLADDYIKFTATANILLVPNQTYYLWIFPGEDRFGWYWGYRANYTSTLTTTGAAMSAITGKDGTLGVEHTLSLTRYASDLTHTITAVCGNQKMTIASGLQADTVKWTPPISWAAQNTTGTSVAVVITCTTYSGSSVIGSTSVTLALTIPPSVVPSVSLSVADKLGYLAVYGAYIQGKSQAEVTVEGAGAYGAAISAYSVTCGSQSKSGAVTVFDLPSSGTIRITVKATDSRGRTASASVSIEVAAYSPPAATITTAYRSDAEGNEDPDGEYASVVFNASITSLDGKNSASYALKYRIRGGTTWSSVPMGDLTGSYILSGTTRVVGVSIENGYEFSVAAADNFVSVDSAYRTIQIAFSLFQIRRSTKSIGFGARASIPNTALFGLAAMLGKGLHLEPVPVSFFEEIDGPLTLALENLEDNGIDFQCFRIDRVLWHCILFKTDSKYATAEFFGHNGRKRKALIDGTWGDLTAEDEDKFQPVTQEAYDALTSAGKDDPTAFYLIVEG